ncbi:DNA cytosine methyltransferase [Blastococcus sp. SYSU DS0539]
MPGPLAVVDLFAGAGGLSEGFNQHSAFRTLAAVEKSPEAAASFKANHPGAQVFVGDIADWLTQNPPTADVVVGGPPCQGFSSLGARQVRDPRNALWRRYVEALVAVRPLYFVLENVADFLRSGQFRDLRRETHKSGRLSNYRIEWAVLNAAEFGVPQVRKRAVVLGSRRDLPPVGIPVGPLADAKEQWVTVRETIGKVDREVREIRLPATRTPVNGVALPGPFKTIELHIGRTATPLSQARYAAIPPGGNRKDLPDDLLAQCWRDHKGGSGDVMGRLHWDRPSVTIRTEFWKPEKGRYLHPEADRAITHFEAARLQGFPEDYLWYGSKAEIGRQIGNAVPVQLAQGIAGHIARQLASV